MNVEFIKNSFVKILEQIEKDLKNQGLIPTIDEAIKVINSKFDCQDCEDTGVQVEGEHDNHEEIKCHCQLEY